MKRKATYIAAFAVMILFSGQTVVNAATPNAQVKSLLEKYQKEAGKPLSSEEGKKFFNTKRTHSVKKEDRSCSTCHTANPKDPGKTVVGKVIEPMAPSVNKERFTDPQKIEKWFKRNCEWVLERECTPKEKGDFITYMFSL